MMKTREEMMGMLKMVEMIAGDLMMIILSTRVQHLKLEGKHREEESLGTATERDEVCRHFGSLRPILQVQQMQWGSKILNQFMKLFKGSTRSSGNKR